jgi:hypothetical protein
MITALRRMSLVAAQLKHPHLQRRFFQQLAEGVQRRRKGCA